MAPARSPPSQIQTTHVEEEEPMTKGDRRRLPNNSPFSGQLPPMAAAPPKSGASAVTVFPIRFFLFFHDAVRSEIDSLHRAAFASTADPHRRRLPAASAVLVFAEDAPAPFQCGGRCNVLPRPFSSKSCYPAVES